MTCDAPAEPDMSVSKAFAPVAVSLAVPEFQAWFVNTVSQECLAEPGALGEPAQALLRRLRAAPEPRCGPAPPAFAPASPEGKLLQ